MPRTEGTVSGAWKARGGLISIEATSEGGTLSSVRITGDFFIYPPEALEELEMALEGTELDREALEDTASRVLGREDVEAPGWGPVDVASALLGPART